MKPLFHPRLLPALLLLCAPAAFVSGCGGGGGGGPVAPTPARTPTASPTPSPTPVTAFIGTYSGTYNFPVVGGSSAASGPFILRVQPDGTATGAFNEGDFEQGFSASGTVSLSTGQVSLSGTTTDKAVPPVTATIKVTGTASSSGASGPLAYSDSLGANRSGNFSTTKTSSSPPVVPTPEPTAIPDSTSLKKGNSFLLKLRARK